MRRRRPFKQNVDLLSPIVQISYTPQQLYITNVRAAEIEHLHTELPEIEQEIRTNLDLTDRRSNTSDSS